jgi:hypothetical protein
LNSNGLQRSDFCAADAHVPKCTLARQFSKSIIFAPSEFKFRNEGDVGAVFAIMQGTKYLEWRIDDQREQQFKRQLL